MLTKDDVTMMILEAKKAAGLGWEDIAAKIDMSPYSPIRPALA